MPCGRAIFQNDSPPIVAPPEPLSFPDLSSRRETANNVEAIDTAPRCAASNLQLTFDRAFRHQLLGVSLPPPRRGRAASYPRCARTGNGRFCNRSPAVKPLRIQLPHRERSFTKERLRVGLRPAAVLYY